MGQNRFKGRAWTAARYYTQLGPDGPYSYEVALYPPSVADPSRYPNDYDGIFSPAQWRSFGCRVPKEGEVMKVFVKLKEG